MKALSRLWRLLSPHWPSRVGLELNISICLHDDKGRRSYLHIRLIESTAPIQLRGMR